ncbi:MAG: DEAD/DEAH box helicase [Chloroflexi bacterium]|nr:DEAD/DEAH box helicase [Chloroflexota bacterium]
MQGFVELGLSPRVLRALEAMGFEEPTPVQQQVVPRMMAGRDVVVQAQTGTGKTAAYGMPIAERVDLSLQHIQALILAPTRELTLQVATELSRIAQFQGVSVLPIYGGQSYDHQIRSLRRGVQVVVATPGRLLDLLARRLLTLAAVRLVILDEADEMLDMGFLEDVERILRQTPPERQTALFSATIPKAVLLLANSYLRQPEHIILSQPRAATVPTVEQYYYLVYPQFKVEALTRLLDGKSPQLALVFCATKRMAANLALELQSSGYRAEGLHGDMTQAQREAVMRATRTGQVDVLVATDVAARGLDIPEVSHVINFDIPQDPDHYIHRIGRTARAGRAGEALTVVTPRELSLLRVIQGTMSAPIQHKELPTVAEVEEREQQTMAAQLEQVLLQGQWQSFRPHVESVAQRHNPLDVAAAALSMAFGGPRPRQEIPRVSPPEKEAARAPYRGPRAARGRSFGGGSRGHRRHSR